MRDQQLVLGIDGGGTKTVAWLAELDAGSSWKVIGRGDSEGSNCRSIGLTQATQNLEQAIGNAFLHAKLSCRPVASACLALAGADRAVEQEQIRHWAKQRGVADRLAITNDAIPVLYAANRSGIGVALISGTGSVAVGRTAEGVVGRCGGWGHLIGDEGSAYRIALEGMKATARCADGRGEETSLLSRTLDRFHLRNPIDLIPILYAETSTRAEIAQFAPVVFEAAESGDATAGDIIERASNDLSDLVTATVKRLSIASEPLTLAVGGGVLLNQPTLVARVRSHVETRLDRSVETIAVPDAAAGAVQIGVDALG